MSKNQPPPPTEPPMAAPAPAPEPAPPPAPKPEKIVLDDVLFDFDKSTLKPAGQEILDVAASVIRGQPGVRYHISGHTDSRGSDAYNQGLSQRRVNTVHDYLIQRGVPASQLSSSAHGESQPIASNDTDAGRAKNRRVEIEPVD